MKRIDIFRIKQTTAEILGNIEAKKPLDDKQIYALAKLNRRADAINKHTSEKEVSLRDALVMAKPDISKITDPVKKADAMFSMESMQRQYDRDREALFAEDVEFEVEVKLPFELCSEMLHQLGQDATICAFEFLIAEPVST